MPATLNRTTTTTTRKKKKKKTKKKADDPVTAAVKIRLPLYQKQVQLHSSVKSTHGVTRLFDSLIAFVRTNRLSSVVRFLENDEQLINGTCHYNGFTLLHNAIAYNGDATMVKTLLRYGANVNARSARCTFEWTPLHVAASVNKWQHAALLLESTADINAVDSNGQTPLHVAASCGHEDFVLWLLEHDDCDALRLDAQGHTAQYYALKAGHLALSERMPGRKFNMYETLRQTDAFRLEYLPRLEKAKEAKKAKAAKKKAQQQGNNQRRR